MIAFIAKPLGIFLNFLYSITGSYGIAIILFTLAIKLILLPLTLQQLKQTKQMAELQPKMKELQNKYKNDKEQLNIKIMELYKDYKINPLGGCLPLLIQMPIIFGLFALLRQPTTYIADPHFVKVVNEAFLWIPNLSKPDPIILPILAGITTYFSMNMVNTGTVQNPTMKTMNKIFPFLVLWWGRSFPAGLTMYWVISNVFQMIQQYFMPKAGMSKEESN